jgi:orotate phosphoribosyltransferase
MNGTETPLSLALRLVEAGLIQFGRFAQPDGSCWPVQVRLRWLPSYPVLLREVAAALADLLDGLDVDRLLSTPAAIPLGTALSLHTDLPMTYALEGIHDRPAAFVIEGAYDVGHPTLLLTDVLATADQAEHLIALGSHTGLEVHTVLAAFDLGIGGRGRLEVAGYQVVSLMTLPALLDPFAQAGLVPAPLRASIERWLATTARATE